MTPLKNKLKMKYTLQLEKEAEKFKHTIDAIYEGLEKTYFVTDLTYGLLSKLDLHLDIDVMDSPYALFDN